MQTAWGSRDGADDDDAFRMIRVSQKRQEATVDGTRDVYAQRRAMSCIVRLTKDEHSSFVNLVPALECTA